MGVGAWKGMYVVWHGRVWKQAVREVREGVLQRGRRVRCVKWSW